MSIVLANTQGAQFSKFVQCLTPNRRNIRVDTYPEGAEVSMESVLLENSMVSDLGANTQTTTIHEVSQQAMGSWKKNPQISIRQMSRHTGKLDFFQKR